MNQHHGEEKNRDENLAYLDGTNLLVDPGEDVADLFQNFNKRFFWGKLKYVEVSWSPRMTLCAGLCVYKRRPGLCSIRLSRPLLSLRAKVDLVETLLHEMIHAYLFVTENNRDRDGHGPEFLKHMDRINKEVGLNISVYHTFSDEVRLYQKHVWLCNGPCQTRPPYFGKVHRAMNRAPGSYDFWWSEHLESCGGTYSKISEPEGYEPPKKKKVLSKKVIPTKNCLDIRTFFGPVNKKSIDNTNTSPKKMSFPGVHNTDQGETTLISIDKKSATSEVISGTDTHQISDINNSKDITNISSEESDSDNDNTTSDTSSNDDGIFGNFASIFDMPLRFFKRKADESSDPHSIKIRKPDFNAVSSSKGKTLKNLISVPDQPTLDAFYQKKKFSSKGNFSKTPSSNTGNKKNLNQPLLKSFFKKKSTL